MKFDFVIGNPPYQDNKIGDNENYAPPVYQFFMNAAFAIANRVELITPARFLFNAGSTPKQWNKKMINDSHFKVLRLEQKSDLVFPGTDIKGGGRNLLSRYKQNIQSDKFFCLPFRIINPY